MNVRTLLFLSLPLFTLPLPSSDAHAQTGQRDTLCLMPKYLPPNTMAATVCGKPLADTPIPVLTCETENKERRVEFSSTAKGFRLDVFRADKSTPPLSYENGDYQGDINIAGDLNKNFTRFKSLSFDNGKVWIKKSSSWTARNGRLDSSLGVLVCKRTVAAQAGSTLTMTAVNGANYRQAPLPNSIATLFGSELDATTKVLINGVEATVLFKSKTQVNIIIPKTVPLQLAEDGKGGKISVPRYEVRALEKGGEVIALDSYLATQLSPGLFSATKKPDNTLVLHGTSLVPPSERAGKVKVFLTIRGRKIRPTTVQSLVNSPGIVRWWA